MNLLDRYIAWKDPEKALKREQARQRLSILNSGYSRHGASTTKKSLMGWISKGASPDEDIVDNAPTLRDRSRDLFMGSPIATGALKTIRTNVVGHGLVLNSHIDYKYLGLTKEQADEWEQNTEREFKLWANTQNCDAARMCTFGQLQSLALLSALHSGDCFAALPIKKRVGSIYDLRISLIEADRVCNPEPKPKGKNIVGGVEVDEFGAPTFYHIAKHHPGSSVMGQKKEWKSVPVFGSKTGRRQILHVWQDLERPGQRRAVPLLAPVIESIKQLTRYTEAELMAAVVSGMFTVFIKSETPQTPLGQMIDDNDSVIDGQGKVTNEDDDISYEMGNGAIVGLGENESIETANPGRPNTAFDGFIIAISRQIGAALEIPYELLVKHFTASYSASRAALLEAWKMFRMRRQWLVQSFCQPIYEEWLAEAVAKGRIEAPGFFEDESVRAAWCGAKWHGPTQGQLNPLQEVKAATERVEQEFSTREQEAAEMNGGSWDEIHEVRTREEKKRRDDQTIIDNTGVPVQETDPNGDENNV
ncbi:portal protein [Vibrio phage vB_VpaM_XM1]